MGKSTISMVIFHSYVKLPEGSCHESPIESDPALNQGITYFKALGVGGLRAEDLDVGMEKYHRLMTSGDEYPLVNIQKAMENHH